MLLAPSWCQNAVGFLKNGSRQRHDSQWWDKWFPIVSLGPHGLQKAPVGTPILGRNGVQKRLLGHVGRPVLQNGTFPMIKKLSGVPSHKTARVQCFKNCRAPRPVKRHVSNDFKIVGRPVLQNGTLQIIKKLSGAPSCKTARFQWLKNCRAPRPAKLHKGQIS